MKTVTVSAAYIPLVDAAPMIVAEEMGFAEAEGLSLDLVRAPSWSSVRDMLAFGRVDAAHLLSPIPVAMALGLGSVRTPISAVSVLSVNGNVIGVSQALADRLRAGGFRFGFDDAKAAGAALLSVLDGPLRFGVPFPFSMHHELLRYWFEGVGLQPDQAEIRTIPPPLMAGALGAGEVEAFCVGEPWGSIAVERGLGELLLPGAAIWKFAPEKVLAVRTDWAETEPNLLGRIMRAVWKAGRWLSRPESATAAAEILSRPQYLDIPAEVIDRSLSGHLTISPRGEQRHVPQFLEFHNGAASFPWRSQSAWIAQRIAARAGLDMAAADQAARGVFRSDIYRAQLAISRAVMPGASSKLEGSIRQPTPVASDQGRLFLQPDMFFDGRIFDPGPD
ncbi:ABC transporter substrate-binding protein [Rhodophyticola sp. CCM32]|uniref:ABC transporter substrate-binding protein n=1 Tax=Rhodophyticola sp. CCM32 TaxID=2916397 RepID=UPI00107EF014|nr:ABC transporter substrate-binding protein [Rhodophyticola sp. CCM32]QBY01171.1 ABC transporter substrate-binding protein [Rhodophyticola sp. CCM32]